MQQAADTKMEVNNTFIFLGGTSVSVGPVAQSV